jgi:hypothetical protein
MQCDKWGMLEPEAGEILIWKDQSDGDEWVVEYTSWRRELDAVFLTASCHPIYGLKAAILFARNKIAEIKSVSQHYAYDKPVSYAIFFLTPHDSEYIDITDDASAIQVLFQYDNYK